MKKEWLEVLTNSIRGKNMWLVAGLIRQMKSDERQLSFSGIKIGKYDEYYRQSKRIFRENAEVEENDDIMKSLDDYSLTLISSEEMLEKIINRLKEIER